MSHKSQSGPVKVIARFIPTPPSAAQLIARLQHKLALLEDRIADADSYRARRDLSHKNLERLLKQREDTKMALSRLREP